MSRDAAGRWLPGRSAHPEGRPPTHAIRSKARALGVVKGSAVKRLGDRDRRALARLQQHLDAQPIEAIRDGLIGSISRGRLLCEQADAILLASPDIRQEQGLARFAGWLHGRVRRDSELLLLVQDRMQSDEGHRTTCARCGQTFKQLNESGSGANDGYNDHDCAPAVEESAS
jgi:hypothetical protein